MNKKIQRILLVTILIVVGCGLYAILICLNKTTKNNTSPSPTTTIVQTQAETGPVILDNIEPNQIINSPLVITGRARGTWFFEASFPVFLTDWDGRIIAQGIAQAKSDWMTTDYVQFETILTFVADKDVYSNRGALIFKKDNPSDLPENDDALEIPVIIAGPTEKK